MYEWDEFQNEALAKTFAGFNVVDSVGYYKGKPEQSKVVTIVTTKDEMSAVEELARRYAKKFQQDSVMIVTVPVEDWIFVRGEKT